MHSKYIALLALVLCLLSLTSFAQNMPNNENYPAGFPQYVTSPPNPVTGSDPNIIYSFVPTIPITDTSIVNVNTPASDAKQQVSYLDGFQRVFVGISKNAADINGNQWCLCRNRE